MPQCDTYLYALAVVPINCVILAARPTAVMISAMPPSRQRFSEVLNSVHKKNAEFCIVSKLCLEHSLIKLMTTLTTFRLSKIWTLPTFYLRLTVIQDKYEWRDAYGKLICMPCTTKVYAIITN